MHLCSNAVLCRDISARWIVLTSSDREPYEAMAAESASKYNEAVLSYKKEVDELKNATDGADSDTSSLTDREDFSNSDELSTDPDEQPSSTSPTPPRSLFHMPPSGVGFPSKVNTLGLILDMFARLPVGRQNNLLLCLARSHKPVTQPVGIQYGPRLLSPSDIAALTNEELEACVIRFQMEAQRRKRVAFLKQLHSQLVSSGRSSPSSRGGVLDSAVAGSRFNTEV